MDNRLPRRLMMAVAVTVLAAFGVATAGTAAHAAPASTAAHAAPAGTAAHAAPAGTAAAAIDQVSAQSLPAYATWVADVTAVTDLAKQYLNTRLPDRDARPAIVLDIDNTALESGYSTNPLTPATKPVLALATQAQAAGAAVYFVTARPEIIRSWTEWNLHTVGYTYAGIYLRPTFDVEPNQALKTNARIAIEKQGYTIVANIGNSASDLDGGHAERTFKLPDYQGQLS